MTQQYGTVKCDVITFTSGTTGNETDVSITVSGLGNIQESGITITGNITGDNITATGDLTVSGIGQFASGTAAAPSITFIGDNDLGLFTSAANTLDITTNGSRKVTINQDGKIGVGTATPTANLEIENNGATTIRLVRTNTSSNYCLIEAAGSNSETLTIETDPAGVGGGNIVFKNGGSERARINPSGRLGIGTTNPTQLIDLEASDGGRIAFTDTGTRRYSIGNAGTGSSSLTIRDESGSADRLIITNGGNVGIGTSSPGRTLAIYNSDPGIRLTDSDSASNHFDVRNVTGDGLLQTTGSTNIKFLTSSTERMRIANSGNVGINTSNPQSKLHVEGTIRNNNVASSATGDYTRVNAGAILRGKGGKALLIGVDYTNEIPYIQGGFADQDTGTRNIALQPNGANIGIGTTSPGAKLDVANNGSGYTAAIELTNTSGNGSSIRSKRGLVLEADYDNNSGTTESDILFTTDGSEKVRIRYDGKVGIGTSSPTELLDIEDTVAARAAFTHTGSRRYSVGTKDNSATFTIRDETGSVDRFTLRSTGNIGIGTENPDSFFHINRSDDNFIKLSTGGSSVSTEQGLLNYGRFISGTTPAFPGQLTSFIKEQRNVSAAEFALLFGTTDSGSNDATEKMRITADGNVGIGTTAPVQELEVSSGSVPTLRLSDTDTALSDDEDSSAIEFYQSDSSGAGVNASIHARGDGSIGKLALQFNTGDNTEKMRITANGNVGIGEVNPEQKLDVTGSVQSSGGFIFGATKSYLYESAADSVSLRLGSDGPYVEFIDIGSNQMEFGNASGELAITAAGGEKIRVKGNGDVGIGTASPASRLEVVDGGGSGSAQVFRVNRSNGSDACVFRIDLDPDANIVKYQATGTQNGVHAFGVGGGSESMRITADGKLLVGTSSSRSLPNGQGQSQDNTLQIEANGDICGLTLSSFRSNNTGPANLILSKANGSQATPTSVTSSSILGQVTFNGYDGSNFIRGAKIEAAINGAPGTNDMPTRLSFYTTDDGSTTPTERMRIAPDGYIGIGTDAPDSPLEIKTTSANDLPLIRINTFRPAIRFVDVSTSAADGEIVQDSGVMKFRISEESSPSTALTERMRLNDSGRLALGTTNTGVCLRLTASETDTNFDPTNGNTTSVAALVGGATAGVNNVGGTLCLSKIGSIRPGVVLAAVQTSSDADQMGLAFYTHESATTNNTVVEQARITHAGHFIVGSTSVIAESSGSITGATIYNNGITGFSATNDRALFLKRLNSNGTIASFRRDNTQVGTISVTTTSTTYNTSSDYRLKENVVELGGAIDRVNQLQPKRFNFITEPGTTVDGFLAHEAQAVVPEAVTGTHNEVDDEGNPVMQGIDQSKLVPLLTAALQEALAKIETLEQRLNSAGL